MGQLLQIIVQLSFTDSCSKALLISEAAILLERISNKENRKYRPTNGAFFDLSLAYCKRFATLNHVATIGEARKFLSEWKHGPCVCLNEEEMLTLGNLWPSSSEEAKSLKKSLERIPDDALQKLLI